MVTYNIEENSFEIVRGVDIKNMLPIKTNLYEKVLITLNSGDIKNISEIVKNSIFFNTNLSKYWVSKNIFKDYNTKLFTKLVVEADKDVEFKLIYDDKHISFTTYKSGLNEFIFKITGKQLKLEISSKENSGLVQKVYLDYYDY